MARLDDFAKKAARRTRGPELPQWWALAAGVFGVLLAALVLFRLGSDSSKDSTKAISIQTTVFSPLNSTTTPPPTSDTTQPPESSSTLETGTTQPQSGETVVDIETLSGSITQVPASLVKSVQDRALKDVLSSQASVLSTILRSDDITGYYLDVTLDIDGTSGNSEVTFYYLAAGSPQEGWRITLVR